MLLLSSPSSIDDVTHGDDVPVHQRPRQRDQAGKILLCLHKSLGILQRTLVVFSHQEEEGNLERDSWFDKGILESIKTVPTHVP